MEVHKGNIFGILNGDKQFLIPVYQRYYSWELKQCKRLWNDIVVMQKEKKVGHFVKNTPLVDILREMHYFIEFDGEQIYITHNNNRKEIVIYPSMLKQPSSKDIVYLSEAYLKYAKSYSLDAILSVFGR